MTALLDANVLIALTDTDHVHHDLSRRWLQAWSQGIATCPVTQGALVRFILRSGGSTGDATAVVRDLRRSPRHEFWADALSYDDVDLRGVIGHRQVTDAYLAALARDRHARLATLDGALATLHSDVALLVG